MTLSKANRLAKAYGIYIENHGPYFEVWPIEEHAGFEDGLTQSLIYNWSEDHDAIMAGLSDKEIRSKCLQEIVDDLEGLKDDIGELK
jgi:hypothetical protein